MGITFRHDAAAVVPPSNNATRKYGQSLVLQQQQQKYAAQQAGYDRMFDAYKMENQQQFQDKRDTKQVINQQLRDWQQQDFQKQQMEAARQQQFMDDARKLSSGMIMDDIKNGHYDPATAGKLRKNLVDEADALADKTLDATQRKKVLDAIRADRLLHTSNRMEKPPAPTDQDRIDSLPVMDGVRYGKDKDGNPVPVMVQDEKTGAWKPYEKPSSSRSSGQKGAKGDSGASQRPVTFEEYYGADEDKFQEALNAELQTMQDNFVPDPEGKKKMPTREDALNKMRDDYDFRQKALGKAQYGEPTPAKPYGQALEEARQASKNNVKGGYESFNALADMNDKLLELENRANSFPKGSKEASAAWSQYRKERDRIINGDVPPAPEMRSILEQPGQQKIPATPMPGQPVPTAPSAPSPAQPAPSPPVAVTPPSPAQNAWEQVATPPATPTPEAPTEQGLVNPQANAGDASKYPWLKQPGKLMSENKAGQASSPITIETASSAAKQYETASQQLQTLQSQAAAMDAKIQSLQGRKGRSGVRSTQTNQEIAKLKKERQQLNLGIRSAQNTMQASDKFVRGYYDQEVAKQPAVQALAKAGKRPQDFAQAEFQLKNLRMQYPDMSTMPEEAKKQLKEAMAVIQAGR